MAAEELKSQGNNLFQAGNYKEAIEFYTKAIEAHKNSPNSESNPAAFYTNRSACYFQLKQFQQSLDDASESVNVDPTWLKGYSRECIALLSLGRPKEALQRALIAKNILGSLNDNLFKDIYSDCWKSYIESYFLSKSSSKNIELRWINDQVGRGVFYSKNGISDEGIILYREDPLISQISPNCILQCCGYCHKTKILEDQLKPNFDHWWAMIYRDESNGLPFEWKSCPSCSLISSNPSISPSSSSTSELTNIETLPSPENQPSSKLISSESYCSQSCLKSAFHQYHELLCPNSKFWVQSKYFVEENLPHPMEFLVQAARSETPVQTNMLLVCKMLASVILNIGRKNGSDSSIEEALEPFRMFKPTYIQPRPSKSSSQVITSLKMLYELYYKDNRSIIQILNRVINEDLYHEFNGILIRNANTTNPVSDFHLFLESLKPIEQQILVNSVDENMTPMEFVQSSFMHNLCPIGTGLFEITNSINHSCVPNSMIAHVTTHNEVCLVSKRRIRKGEELTISYIDETLPYQERKAKLNEFYQFECSCPKCTEESKTPTSSTAASTTTSTSN